MSTPTDTIPTVMDIVSAHVEVHRLKARYVDCVDGKDYSTLASLFTKDATLMVPLWSAPKPLIEAMAAYESTMAQYESVHTASLPVIDVPTPTRAKAVWHMQDRLYTHLDGDRYSLMQGHGRYTETYRCEEGQWLISSLVLTRTRKDRIQEIVTLRTT